MLHRKPLVLIVEEDGPLLKVLTRYLEAAGYVVLQATSFREAAERSSTRPEPAMLDIDLPDGTGRDVATWIGWHRRGVPVIVMPGVGGPSAGQLAKVNARAFLAKPFAVEEMLEVVKGYAPAS